MLNLACPKTSACNPMGYSSTSLGFHRRVLVGVQVCYGDGYVANKLSGMANLKIHKLGGNADPT